MSTIDVNQVFRELLGEHIAPALRHAGYRKHGAVWNRSKDGFVRVVDVQRRSRRTSHIEFTLNLGVWFEEVWTACWAKEPPTVIREEDCFPRFRVGQLLGGFEPRSLDKWWSVGSTDEVSELGEELARLLMDECLPLLDRLDTKSKALTFAREELPIRLPLEKLYLAIFECLVGSRTRGESMLSDLAADAHWGQRAQGALEGLREAESEG